MQRHLMLSSCLLLGLLSAPGSYGSTPLKNQPPYRIEQFSILHDEERLEYSDDWRQGTVRTLPSNGHLHILLHLGERRCADIDASVEGVTYFSLYPTQIDTPSYAGGATGIFYEALVPRNNASCGLSPFVLAEWQPKAPGQVFFSLDQHRVVVDIQFDGHFVAPKKPFFIGLTNSFLIKGHCPDYCRMEVELGNAYRAMLQSHHLTPYFNWIRVPPIVAGKLDLDAHSDSGASFRQQVMDGNNVWVAFPRASDQKDPIAYLKALENTIISENLVGRAWVYAKDEPTDFNVLETELNRYRTYAPHVLTMVTTPAQKSLMSGVDIFTPVMHQLIGKNLTAYQNKRLWTYTSCMGSCGPNRAWNPLLPNKVPGRDTQVPDLLIDRPASSIKRYFKLVDSLGAQASLYYHAVEGYVFHQQVDQFDDPWNFGGNGDGLLVYPGIPGQFGLDSHQPITSFRLKLLRREIERQSQTNSQ